MVTHLSSLCQTVNCWDSVLGYRKCLVCKRCDW